MTDPITSLHYASNGNLATVNGVYTYAPGADGFNLADVSSLGNLNALPAGVKGLVYLGMTDGVTDAFKAAVAQYVGNPNLYGFYVADQPTTIPAANIKAEADYIHANVPGAITFLWVQNTSAPNTPVYNLYNPQNTDIDLFGISPQPVRPQFSGGMDLSVITDAVNAAVAGGVPLADIVPIYQAFGGGGLASTYSMPTAAQEQQILSTWGASVPAPAFDFAYSWGVQDSANAISTAPDLQQVFAAHNAQAASSPPPAPVFTGPADGTIDTTSATPTISGTGVPGDSVTLVVDGTTVGSAMVVAGDSTWSYTPMTALSNGNHTLVATQAAAGGTSSTAATTTFTVALAAAPASPTNPAPAGGGAAASSGGGQTISTAVVGQVYLTPASNPLTITSTGSVTNAAGGDAINAPAGTAWTINNDGSVSGAATASSAGIYSPAAGISVQNTGKLSGSVAGLWLAAGGVVSNSATGVISATGSYGVYMSGAPGTVTNLGKISGATYAVDLSFSSAANRVVVGPGAVFTGAVSGGNGTLELTAGAGSGAVTGLNTGGTYTAFTGLVVDAGATWTLGGTNTITSVTDAGSLVITGTLPAATYQIGAAGGGGTLEVATASGTASPISFVGASTLIVDNASAFGSGVGGTGYTGPLLEGFGAGDTVDIKTISASNATFAYNAATGLLQITSGGNTATLAFQPSSLGSGSFNLASDGAAGVAVTLSQAPPPAAPTITSPANGSVDTTTTTPVIAGTGVSGDTVSVSIDGAVVGTAPVGNGAWTFTPTNALTNAGHTVTATQAAAGGPSSAPSAADTFTVNVPPAPPLAPTVTSPASGSIDTTTTTPVIAGTGVSGDTVSVSIDGAVVGTTPVSNGTWTFTPTAPLTNAGHTVTATQAAAGGPSSAPSAADTFTVSVASPPAAPTITSPANGSVDTTTTTPVIAGTGISGDTVSVSIDGTVVGTAPVTNGAWTFTPTSALTNAGHTVTATQAAAGGPSSAPSASDTFTVNVPPAPPPAPTITSPANGSIDTTTTRPAIAGTGVSGDTVSVSIDGTVVGTAPVTNGAWTFTPTTALTNAGHTVTATQAAAGGPSSAPSAGDTFTVSVTGGLTIDTATTGPLTLAPANNPVTITSAGSVKATASGANAIDGPAGTNWSIANAGTVSSTQHYGISLKGSGGSIVNSGTISGNGSSSGYGVDLEKGGALTNTATGTITGGEDAVFVYAAPATITNSGTISSSFDDGLGLFAGGNVVNNVGGVIKAPTSGGFGPAAIYVASGPASVLNRGSISGQYGVYYGVAGTVENAGTISGTSYAVDFTASSSTNRLIVDPGATFVGKVTGGGGVLELAAGSGSIGQIGSSAFNNFATLTDDPGGAWTLTGTNTIANVLDNGSLTIGGSLNVTSAVSAASTGQFIFQSGGSLDVAADVAANSKIDFLGAGQLTIDNAASFGTGVGGTSYAGPLLQDFGAGDRIDLHNFAVSALSMLYDANSGLLQISNGSNKVATLDFQTSTLGSGTGFTAASDGNGGLWLTHG